MKKEIVIIGAGPAGLTAALELQSAGVFSIKVLESDNQVGGISRTVNYNGNRIDIGGHRFFSKSDWVMNWWTSIIPIQKIEKKTDEAVVLAYKGKTRDDISRLNHSDVDDENIMLVRNRLSRIYFNRQFFDYPLKLNFDTVRKLGVFKAGMFGLSYVWSRIRPLKKEKSLEDFFINRFGRRLYHQFFKEYTEKVWGVPCSEISADWGAQRIKSLSVTKALMHAFKSSLGFSDKKTEQTSLIESFIYPKYGPGQMWEAAAQRFVRRGGNIKMNEKIIGIDIHQGRVTGVRTENSDGFENYIPCTHLISTMPIKDLVKVTSNMWSDQAKNIANSLQYRDFFTVGLLYKKDALATKLLDNWIYIQEPGVNVGRVQIFNNWSPFMVKDPDTVWLGLEFFCLETDLLWEKSDSTLIELAKKEMLDISLTNTVDVLDAVVLRVPKAYPGYFGEAYQKFDILREELDAIDNLFLIGRNGMHRYNNQDHSMLTAKEAAAQIVSGETDKSKIWGINIDDDYHEQKNS